jgi:6-phosphogluconate dehydrogenase
MAVHIGLVGLGKMGGNMRQRLRNAGIEVTGFDFNPEISDAGSLEEMVQALPTPRVVWVMVPAGAPTDATIDKLGGLLEADDLVIDGGNSKFVDDARHAQELAAKGIRFVDCGVSGGVPRAPVRRASSTPDHTAPATTRRWSTTASSTA